MSNPFEVEIVALTERILAALKADPETSDELVGLVLADLLATDAEMLRRNPGANAEIITSVVRKRSYSTQFRRKYFRTKVRLREASNKLSVFISYRRSDAVDIARLIADHLSGTKKFSVAFDLDALRTGLFSRDLGNRISMCDVFLPVYTPDYFSRVDNPEDWVRREMETAIHLDKTVCPVRIDNAPLPDAISLPEEITPILSWNAYPLYRHHLNHCLTELGTSWLKAQHQRRVLSV